MNASQTFVLLKPDAFERQLVNDILSYIQDQGFRLVKQQEVFASAPTIVHHYDEVIKRIGAKTFKPKVLAEFVAKPVLAVVFEHPEDDAVTRMRTLIGATDPLLAKKDTIRGRFGIDSLTQARQENRMLRNLIHASETPQDVVRETDLWFFNNTPR